MNGLISEWTKDQATQLALIAVAVGVVTKAGLWLYRVLRTVGDAAEFLQHELKENSGRSLRDYAVRTDARIEFLFQEQGIVMPDHLKTPPPAEELF